MAGQCAMGEGVLVSQGPSEEETSERMLWPSGSCLSQMELTAGAKAQRQELS